MLAFLRLSFYYISSIFVSLSTFADALNSTSISFTNVTQISNIYYKYYEVSVHFYIILLFLWYSSIMINAKTPTERQVNKLEAKTANASSPCLNTPNVLKPMTTITSISMSTLLHISRPLNSDKLRLGSSMWRFSLEMTMIVLVFLTGPILTKLMYVEESINLLQIQT